MKKLKLALLSVVFVVPSAFGFNGEPTLNVFKFKNEASDDSVTVTAHFYATPEYEESSRITRSFGLKKGKQKRIDLVGGDLYKVEVVKAEGEMELELAPSQERHVNITIKDDYIEIVRHSG